MKFFLMILGMAAAGVLGYLVEPNLRSALVGEPAREEAEETAVVAGSEADEVEDERTGSAEAAPVADIDPATLAPEQLPPTVKIKSDAKVKDLTPGMTVTIDAGTELKLVRVVGANALLRPGNNPYTFPFPVEKTDLLEQLAANPPPPVTVPEEAPPEPEPEPGPAEESMPEAEPVAEVAPEPGPIPLPAGDSADPVPMPEPPVADNQPEPEPMPEPAPEPAVTPEPAGNDIVGIMKKSIANGEVKEFTLDQVLDWKPGEVETVDGSSYQTGMLTYKAETIFGVRTIQAKALIHNGEVVRWIWPKSGMEIR